MHLQCVMFCRAALTSHPRSDNPAIVPRRHPERPPTLSMYQMVSAAKHASKRARTTRVNRMLVESLYTPTGLHERSGLVRGGTADSQLQGLAVAGSKTRLAWPATQLSACREGRKAWQPSMCQP